MEKISDRINEIIKNEGITIRAFEQKIGCSNGVISKFIKNGSNNSGKATDIQGSWLSKIIDMFPEYDARWLLTGNSNLNIEKSLNIAAEPIGSYRKASVCEKCKLKDELIESLRREISTQGEFIKCLQIKP